MTKASVGDPESVDEVETLRYVLSMLTQLARIAPKAPRSPLAYLLDLARMEVEDEIGRRTLAAAEPASAPGGAGSARADDQGDAPV